MKRLIEQNSILLAQNADMAEQISQLTKTVESLNQTIQKLQEQLNKNSKNSSKPPSSDADYTFLFIHKKRGWAGMNAAVVLPFYHGIIVHDCWGSYWKYEDVIHSICCAHLLRELNGVEENHP